MATRGRKPKPSALKVVTGNPGKRALPEDEPEFTEGDVAPPAWLDERERSWRLDFLAEWERIVGQLGDWATVGEVNQGMLEGICTLYATYVAAAKSKDNTEMRQSFESYRKALNEFGLTPASKARVATPTKQPKGKLAKYTG